MDKAEQGKAWDIITTNATKRLCNEIQRIKESCVMKLLLLGGDLNDLVWDESGDLVHVPSGIGYKFSFIRLGHVMSESEFEFKFIAEPIDKGRLY